MKSRANYREYSAAVERDFITRLISRCLLAFILLLFKKHTYISIITVVLLTCLLYALYNLSLHCFVYVRKPTRLRLRLALKFGLILFDFLMLDFRQLFVVAVSLTVRLAATLATAVVA